LDFASEVLTGDEDFLFVNSVTGEFHHVVRSNFPDPGAHEVWKDGELLHSEAGTSIGVLVSYAVEGVWYFSSNELPLIVRKYTITFNEDTSEYDTTFAAYEVPEDLTVEGVTIGPVASVVPFDALGEGGGA
jgi:hypothetical protein